MLCALCTVLTRGKADVLYLIENPSREPSMALQASYSVTLKVLLSTGHVVWHGQPHAAYAVCY